MPPQPKTKRPSETPRELERHADYGIVTALRDEMLAVLASLGDVEEIQFSQEDIRYYYRACIRCEDGTDQVVVCVQAIEMGQHAAQNAARDLITAWKPRHVLLVGIAGGIAARGVRCGDVIVPTWIHFYEPGKLVRGRRRPREMSYDADSNLQAAVEALALHKPAAWADRITALRPGRKGGTPRVLRDHLASGEEVWADLGHDTVVEVLDRHDKVIAVENEAAGIFNAVRELTPSDRPSVLIIKAASDLIVRKDDKWRKYAADAASTFAVAVIHKVGGRWRTAAPHDGPTAAEQLDIARGAIVGSKFEEVPDEYERAVELAHETGNPNLEREVRAEAARAYLECYSVASLDERQRARIVSLYEAHVSALESLGLAPGKLAVERSYMALLNNDGDRALQFAEEARRLSDEQSDVWVDAILCVIKAHWALGRPEDALLLEALVAQAQSGDRDYGARFAISATWLEARRRAGRATQEDVEVFCQTVRDLVSKEGMPAKRAALSIGPIVEKFNEPESQAAVLSLLECSTELAEEVEEPPLCCTMALQVAEVAGLRGDEPKARLYLGKASTWVEKARTSPVSVKPKTRWHTLRVNWLFGKGRVLVRLSESPSGAGRAKSLLEEAYEAFKDAERLVTERREQLEGEVDLFLADLNVWLGDTASALNRVTEAVTFFSAARSEAARTNAGFWTHRAVPAWLRQAESMALSGRLKEARQVVEELLVDARSRGAVEARAEEFGEYLEHRLVPVVEWFGSEDAVKIKDSATQQGLQQAVAEQTSTLVSWWEEWSDSSKEGDIESALLDWWGRGGFARVAAAIRSKPNSAIAVDAASIEEIRRWARILCPLFDSVVVKWKGELGAGMVLLPIPNDYGGPEAFGGHGYIVTADRVRENWHIQMSWANPLPRQVARFLAGEALSLVATGRLIVLPAALVGCTQNAVGWTDNLLLDGFLGGVISVARTAPGPGLQTMGGQRVLDLSAITVPYMEDIGLAELARIFEETDEWTPRLRSLLMKSVLSEDLRVEKWASITALENDIKDACRELQARFEDLASSGGWRVAEATGSIAAGSRGEDAGGIEPVTGLLRAVAAERRELTPWIPYWRMSNFGGRLAWSWPLDNPSTPPNDPSQPQGLHAWLYPGTGGWGVMPVVVFRGETA